MAEYVTESTLPKGLGPRAVPTDAFPGAPGVPGGTGGRQFSPVDPDESPVQGFGGGSSTVPMDSAFPGTAGVTWQGQPWNQEGLNESNIVNDPSVSDGIVFTSVNAFPGGAEQGV